jgi:hypothetical protein
MQENLSSLYSQSDENTVITGLYLAYQIYKPGTAEAPFVCANFLSSLDERIALEDVYQSTTYISKHLIIVSDFRLFMELHTPADCLITLAGYMRALGEDCLGNILRVRDKYLVKWRRNLN